ncbi:MAG: hypothetical protein AABZ63_03440, partial [Actinomycetota bacterium]
MGFKPPGYSAAKSMEQVARAMRERGHAAWWRPAGSLPPGALSTVDLVADVGVEGEGLLQLGLPEYGDLPEWGTGISVRGVISPEDARYGVGGIVVEETEMTRALERTPAAAAPAQGSAEGIAGVSAGADVSGATSSLWPGHVAASSGAWGLRA